ncbi:MAG: hypothetical protein ACJAS4_002793 [Bacteriovoracaceae bacterium]|jgi:hypothetical protein
MEKIIMEQNTINKSTNTTIKKTESVAIRFDKSFMKQISKIVDKANKKQYGRKIKAKSIIVNTFSILDEKLIDKVIKKSQEESLSANDKKDMYMKENLTKFKGSKEEFEQKMMELMTGFLSQSPS